MSGSDFSDGAFPFGNHVFKCDKHHGTLDMHVKLEGHLKVDLGPSNIAGEDHLSELQSTCGIGLDLQPSAQLVKPLAHTSNPDSDIRSTAIHFRKSLG